MKLLVYKPSATCAIKFTGDNSDDIVNFVEDLVYDYCGRPEADEKCSIVIETIIDQEDQTHLKFTIPVFMEHCLTTVTHLISIGDWVVDATEYRDFIYMESYSDAAIKAVFAEYEEQNNYNRRLQ